MKKALLLLLAVAVGIAAGVVGTLLLTDALLSDGDVSLDPNVYGTAEDLPITNETLTAMALEATGYIKAGNFEALSKMVHPSYGLLFSPYATVSLTSNKSFSVRELAGFDGNTESYVWGVLNDSGEPITMTISDYFQKYVFNRDYTAAPLIGVNYTVRVGNALENVTGTFPNANFVDLCFPGTADAEYMDWSILRLVFEEYEGTLRLTAIIHSEATI